MKKTLNNQISFVFLSLILVITLTACGKSVSERISEKTMEKALENSTGGQADVDINDGNTKVKTDEGTVEVGENVSLPVNFPKDLYVPEGKILSAVSTAENEGYSVMVDTDKTMEELFSTYQTKFIENGWKITSTMNLGEMASVVAEKGGFTSAVTITKNDENVSVILTSGKNE